MTQQWYLCKVQCTRTQPSGAEKKQLEQYLADAQSFTEAEARVAALMLDEQPREFEVAAIQKERYEDVLPLDEADSKWYKVRLAHVTLNEKSGKEKKTYHNLLLQAPSTAGAEARLHRHMEGSLTDYRVLKVEETAILDVLLYTDPATDEQAR